MLNYYKERTLNLKHFKDALTACKEPKTRYYNNQLSLVGVYYRNPLESNILAHNMVTTLPNEEGALMTLQVVLKPDTGDREALELLDVALQATKMGDVIRERPLVETDPSAFDTIGRFFKQGTIFSEVSDYELTFNVTCDTIKQVKFTINKVNYYQYEIFSEGVLGDTNYNQSLVILFKDKEYDNETFFSALLDKPLTLTDGKKILDTLVNENITGLFLGATYIESLDEPSTSAFFGAVTYPSNLDYAKGTYGIDTLESQLVFSGNSIKAVSVRTGHNHGYVVTVMTRKQKIEIHIG